MKITITIRLNSTLLREAKMLATKTGTSIGGLLTAHLEHIVRGRHSYDKARRRALVRLRRGLDLRWNPPVRKELHER